MPLIKTSDEEVLIAYFEDIATKLKDIGHTSNEPHFFFVDDNFNLSEFDAVANSSKDPVMILEIHDGTLSGSSGDNIQDNSRLSFMILKHSPKTDVKAIRAVRNSCRKIGYKVLSKLRKDRTDMKIIFSVDSVKHIKVGPIGDRKFGYMFEFSLPDTINLSYNPADWNA